MTSSVFNSWRSNIFSWFYAFVLILAIAVLVGKQAVSWILMKLYEIFIQRNLVK